MKHTHYKKCAIWIIALIAIAFVYTNMRNTQKNDNIIIDDTNYAVPSKQSPNHQIANSTQVIAYKFDTICLNLRTNNPDWVKWKVTIDKANKKICDRKDYNFIADTSNIIDKSNEVNSDDYSGSGYDRGHMAPAADMSFSRVAMKECHYMTNICPQTSDLNRGIWKSLEDKTRNWCVKYSVVYVVAGPLYTAKDTTWIGKTHKVAIPTKFFKVIMTKKKGQEKAIGFIFDNNNPTTNLATAVHSVDEVEAICGYDFFDWLPDDIEHQIESKASLKDW